MARRSLWPREHGAYFQLAIPLVVACVRLAPTSCALAGAALLAFLANEPLLVVLGHRGPKMLELDGARARVRLAMLATGAAVLGVIGLVLAPQDASVAAAIVAIPAAVVVVLAWRRAEHTLLGELVAAIALTGASVPAAVAGATPLPTALAMWAGWALGFGATVIVVHRVIARHKRAATAIDGVIALGLIALTIALVVFHHATIALAIPLVAVAAILAVAPPPASRLRGIGIAIVVAGVASSAVALAGAIW
jgi:hypothetical protein